MARRKQKRKFGSSVEFHKSEAQSEARSARSLIRLVRSNAKEGWCGHALNHLIHASKSVGAYASDSFSSGRTQHSAGKAMTEALYSAGKRVAACYRKGENK